MRHDTAELAHLRKTLESAPAETLEARKAAIEREMRDIIWRKNSLLAVEARKPQWEARAVGMVSALTEEATSAGMEEGQPKEEVDPFDLRLQANAIVRNEIEKMFVDGNAGYRTLIDSEHNLKAEQDMIRQIEGARHARAVRIDSEQSRKDLQGILQQIEEAHRSAHGTPHGETPMDRLRAKWGQASRTRGEKVSQQWKEGATTKTAEQDKREAEGNKSRDEQIAENIKSDAARASLKKKR